VNESTLEALRQNVEFDGDGLIPAVVQNGETGEVLMVAYMNMDSLAMTFEKGDACFWSRSRQELWHKGATSGNTMAVRELRIDCDTDTILVIVEPSGPACHTGARSCFFRTLNDDGSLTQHNE
jgi:phosphoribosyl-AMP cyclohydrolase